MSLQVRSYDTRSGWSWRVKLGRIAWAPFRILFIGGTSRYLSPLRVAALKLFGAKLAAHVLIMDGVKVWYPWNLEMDEGSSLGVDVEVYNFAPIRIGAHSTVSQYSYLCTASHDYTLGHLPLVYRPIVLEDQVWVAAGAFVGPGVTVGQGAVVGAMSVVTSSVAPWTVVAGNPAREIKKRILID
jgi:putative colanic acid biosynthesis acetyltransferase WcaF